jgi:hypothetical protein
MMKHDREDEWMARDIKFRAAWWLKLKQLGYDVIPLSGGKNGGGKGWPTKPNDEVAIRRWNGSGAAIRLYRSDLFVIDFDVHAAEVRDKMLAWLTEHHPSFMAKCLRRHSGAITIALIGRCVTAKGTTKTARYSGEGTAEKGDFVEVFTSNSKKYVGVVGLRSRGREYDYYGKHIIETPEDTLPWFMDNWIAPMRAAFEKIMAAHGWVKVIPVLGEEAKGTKVYDLLPEMIFMLSDGTEVTLEELEDMAHCGMTLAYDHKNPSVDTRLRGYATLWDPSTGGGDHSSTRVLVTYGSEGLCLYDTKYDVRHRWKSCEPSKASTELTATVRELMETMRRASEVVMTVTKREPKSEWCTAQGTPFAVPRLALAFPAAQAGGSVVAGRASGHPTPAVPKHPPAPYGPSGQCEPKLGRDYFRKLIARRAPPVWCACAS